MKTPQNQIDDLVTRPSEGLPVEIKSWIDPASPEGTAKIVRACLAMRNQNGGFLIIGLHDKTLQPESKQMPANVRDTFHVDKVQQLVSRYSYEAFEIEVAFAKRDGLELPVVVVPGGVQYPIASKADLNAPDGKRLIRAGDVYCRTLNSNGRASTAVAQPKDWRDIFDRCFENREADIGRFLRRHIGPSADKLFLSHFQPSQITLEQQALSFLDDGTNRFAKEAKARNLTGTAAEMENGAKFEAALIISPPKTDELATTAFYQTLAASNPRLTGWPIWLDSSGFVDQSARPVVSDDSWKTFIVEVDAFNALDFQLLNPNGRFYFLRALQDDFADEAVPEKYLDPINTILRVAETIAVGISFARGLGWTPDETRLAFAFRWSKLKGRKLEPWANPGVYLSSNGISGTELVTSTVEIPLDTPLNAIAPAVETVVRRLFVVFNGYELPSKVIENWTRRLIERRL